MRIALISFSRTLDAEGIRLGFYHGSPESYNHRVYEDDPPELVEEYFNETDLNLAALGNTHVRMDRTFGSLRIINPGAVGISNDEDTRAGFGILDIEKGKVGYSQNSVAYPLENCIRDVKTSDMPYRDIIAEQLRTGEPTKSLFRQEVF